MSCTCSACLELDEVESSESEEDESTNEGSLPTSTEEEEESEESEWESEGSVAEEDDYSDLMMSSRNLPTYPHYFVYRGKNKRNRTSVTEEKTVEALDQNLIMDLTRIVSQFSMEIWKVDVFNNENLFHVTSFFSSKELADFYRDQQRREQINTFLPNLCWVRGKMSEEQYLKMFQESFLPLEKYLESYQIQTTYDGILRKLFKNNILSLPTYRLKDSTQDRDLDQIVALILQSQICKRFNYLYVGLRKIGIAPIVVSMVQYSDSAVREAFEKRQKLAD